MCAPSYNRHLSLYDGKAINIKEHTQSKSNKPALETIYTKRKLR